MTLQGIDYLRRKLAVKRPRVLTRYRFYEMKHTVRDFGISTPPSLRYWQSAVRWCAKAVDTLAMRLRFREFGNDAFGLNEIYSLNNRDILFRSAVLSALIASCSFLYLSEDETGFPRLQALDGGSATGILDPVTNLLTEGYAVLDWTGPGGLYSDTSGGGIFAGSIPFREAYFTPEWTYILENGRQTAAYPNRAHRPLLVPVLFQPDAARPFGHSRISRACMELTESALRTLKRAEISAEFYSYPQKYVLGTDPGAEYVNMNAGPDGEGGGTAAMTDGDRWRMSMSAMLDFSANDRGEAPKVGQFSQQSMSPHSEMLKTIAGQFAMAADLTLDDMGFPTDNPSSAEAIKSAHENLRLTALDAQATFGTGFLNAGYLAACIRDNYPYSRRQLAVEVPKWEPIFTPDASMLAGIGDAVGKINAAVPGYFGRENLRDLTGINGEG